MSNESFAVSSDRDRFKWAYKHSRQLESLFFYLLEYYQIVESHGLK